MDYSGIYKDGWVEERARVTLKGGGPASLVLRAEVLPREGQRLDILVDGRPVVSEDVESGLLNLRVPLPPSAQDRRVELLWAGSRPIGPNDSRQAAALLRFLDVIPQRYPVVLRIPEGLGDAGLELSGIHADGWVDAAAHVMLAGGPATELIVQGDVPADMEQRLEVLVDEQPLLEEKIAAGFFRARTPVPASEEARRVDLRWGETSPLGPDDPRFVGARLHLVGLAPGGAPRSVRIPRDLSEPGTDYAGIQPDGWMEQQCQVTLAGGGPAELVVRAELSPVPGQRLTILADEATLATHDVDPGPAEFRVRLPPSERDRLIRLQWGGTTAVSKEDSRQVAGLLRFLGLATGRPPSALRRFPADLEDPELHYEGIYTDGWLQQESRFTLSGGGACDLALRLDVPPSPGQSVDVVVDGEHVHSRGLEPGITDLRAPLPAAARNRSIELRFARAMEINDEDDRHAAAHLKHIALLPKSRP